MNKRYHWMGVICDTERSKAAVHSWFAGVVPDSWGLPLKADVQEDELTGGTPQMRALYRRPDGSLREAFRRASSRHTTFGFRTPTPAILKGWRDPADAAPQARTPDPRLR